MSEDELDQKLEEFKGPITTFDEQTKKKLSTILTNLEDEPSQPDNETYRHLYNLVGSPLLLIIYLISTFILQWIERSVDTQKATYANVNPET